MTPEEWAEHWTARADVCWVMAATAEQYGQDDKASDLRQQARKAERAAYRWRTNMVGTSAR